VLAVTPIGKAAVLFAVTMHDNFWQQMMSEEILEISN
jgi:hypothetical protein